MQQIPLSQNQVVLLDDNDFDRFSQFHWCYRGERGGAQGYAIRHVKMDRKYKTSYLHREIANPQPGQEVIFLNYDRLDCRRENLRVVTQEEARRHHRVRSDSKTGVKGVKYNRRPGTWSVDVYRGGSSTRLGTFLTKEHAIAAYEKALKKENPDLHIAPETVKR